MAATVKGQVNAWTMSTSCRSPNASIRRLTVDEIHVSIPRIDALKAWSMIFFMRMWSGDPRRSDFPPAGTSVLSDLFSESSRHGALRRVRAAVGENVGLLVDPQDVCMTRDAPKIVFRHVKHRRFFAGPRKPGIRLSDLVPRQRVESRKSGQLLGTDWSGCVITLGSPRRRAVLPRALEVINEQFRRHHQLSGLWNHSG